MRKIIFISFLASFTWCYSQTETFPADLLKPNPEKEAQYLPFLAVRHGGLAEIENWKKNNTLQYYKELWYFCESFYIKRNYLTEGIALTEAYIDITRFEYLRKEAEESFVVIPGTRDAIVLLPANKLIYKAQF